MKLFLSTLTVLFAITPGARGAEITARFDHEFHRLKVFEPRKVQCSHCHFFSQETQGKKITLDPQFKDTSLKLPLKQICHECHQSPESQHPNAPKECYACHRSLESLDKIKPLNHKNVAWKDSHSTVARIQGDSCFSCHTQSTCTKCHLQRNDIQMNNHSRNFRFFHSVQARLQPQKCGTCHTTNFCVGCHLGKTPR